MPRNFRSLCLFSKLLKECERQIINKIHEEIRGSDSLSAKQCECMKEQSIGLAIKTVKNTINS